MLEAITSQTKKSRTVNLLSNTRGTDQTARTAARMIRDGARRPVVLAMRDELVRNLPAHDKRAEAQAIFNFAERAIRYTDDPTDADTCKGAPFAINEYLAGRRTPADCVSQTILVGALARSLSIPVRLIVIGDGLRPRAYYHIYPELLINNAWIAADVTAATAASSSIREISGLGYLHPAGRARTYNLEGVGMLELYTQEYTGARRRAYVRPRGRLRGIGTAPAPAAKAEDKTATASTLEGGETGGKGSIWGAAFGVLKKLATGVGLAKKARAGRLAAQDQLIKWNEAAKMASENTAQYRLTRIPDELHNDLVRLLTDINNGNHIAAQTYRAEAGF